MRRGRRHRSGSARRPRVPLVFNGIPPHPNENKAVYEAFYVNRTYLEQRYSFLGCIQKQIPVLQRQFVEESMTISYLWNPWNPSSFFRRWKPVLCIHLDQQQAEVRKMHVISFAWEYVNTKAAQYDSYLPNYSFTTAVGSA